MTIVLAIVKEDGSRFDDRSWDLADAQAAMRALYETREELLHLAVVAPNHDPCVPGRE